MGVLVARRQVARLELLPATNRVQPPAPVPAAHHPPVAQTHPPRVHPITKTYHAVVHPHHARAVRPAAQPAVLVAPRHRPIGALHGPPLWARFRLEERVDARQRMVVPAARRVVRPGSRRLVAAGAAAGVFGAGEAVKQDDALAVPHDECFQEGLLLSTTGNVKS